MIKHLPDSSDDVGVESESSIFINKFEVSFPEVVIQVNVCECEVVLADGTKVESLAFEHKLISERIVVSDLFGGSIYLYV